MAVYIYVTWINQIEFWNFIWTIYIKAMYKKNSLDNNFRGRAGDYNMKKVFFVFLLIFSLLIIGGKEYKCESKEDSFSKI